MAAAVAPAVVFFAAGAGVYRLAAGGDATPVVSDTGRCCAEIVAAAPAASSSDPSERQLLAASRYRVVEIPRALPVGVASERGLQVRTILVARSLSAVFPEIHQIDGCRPDALPWHPNGLALDVMIPNPGSDEGISLGNQIVAFVMKNATRFGIQDAIWRGTYYTPSGPQGTGYGHYDHVHVTTTGGGYPTGAEIYYR